MIDSEALIRAQDASYARASGSLASSWPRESAMDATQLGSFLEERRYCVLATTNSEGRAIARPVAFTVLVGSFWFATVRGARLRNLERIPWVSIVIDDGDRGTHRAVAVDGPVTVSDRPPPRLVDLWDERHGSRAEWAAAWFELKPQRLVSYMAGETGA
jgi:nitroimidazol reductase NimA-like FMN-containing flavoprotein (pyridoxamine 5'-phosphate oxidase superfamily)